MIWLYRGRSIGLEKQRGGDIEMKISGDIQGPGGRMVGSIPYRVGSMMNGVGLAHSSSKKNNQNEKKNENKK